MLILGFDPTDKITVGVFGRVVELLFKLTVQLLHVLLVLSLTHLQSTPLQGQLLLQIVDKTLQVQVLLHYLLRFFPELPRHLPSSRVERVSFSFLAGKRFFLEFGLTEFGLDLLIPPPWFCRITTSFMGAKSSLMGLTHNYLSINNNYNEQLVLYNLN